MELGLGDCVRYLLLLLHRNGVPFSFLKHDQWHLAFYDLKETPEIADKPRFLHDLFFDWDRLYPKCQALEEFLNALCTTGCVETTSPRYEEWNLPKNIAELWSQHFEALDEPTKRFLNAALAIAQARFQKTGQGR